jgi:hypothetical protein
LRLRFSLRRSITTRHWQGWNHNFDSGSHLSAWLQPFCLCRFFITSDRPSCHLTSHPLWPSQIVLASLRRPAHLPASDKWTRSSALSTPPPPRPNKNSLLVPSFHLLEQGSDGENQVQESSSVPLTARTVDLPETTPRGHCRIESRCCPSTTVLDPQGCCRPMSRCCVCQRTRKLVCSRRLAYMPKMMDPADTISLY